MFQEGISPHLRQFEGRGLKIFGATPKDTPPPSRFLGTLLLLGALKPAYFNTVWHQNGFLRSSSAWLLYIYTVGTPPTIDNITDSQGLFENKPHSLLSLLSVKSPLSIKPPQSCLIKNKPPGA